MGRIKNRFVDHISEFTHAALYAAIAGFGLICFALGKYDC